MALLNAGLAASYRPLCSKDECIYTSCYCEENVWKFLERAVQKGCNPDDLYAVFVSNSKRSIPVWYQKRCLNVLVPVIWDYHVFAVHRDPRDSKAYVYDFDTLLRFPEPFDTYVSKSFNITKKLAEKYVRSYRVIPCRYYLENFASNRSHMINKETGAYMEPPPTYQCIRGKKSENNIEEFIEMIDNGHGVVLDEDKFKQHF